MVAKRGRFRRVAGILALIPLHYLLLVTGTAGATFVIIKRTNQVFVERVEAITAKLKAMR